VAELKTFQNSSQLNLANVLISDIIGDTLTAPFRYMVEIKRGWTQLGIKNPIKSFPKFGLSTLSVFLARDIVFRLGFNTTYFTLFSSKKQEQKNYSYEFLGLIFSISVGVLLSQFLDLIFIRITNEQVNKYTSVADAFKKIMREEGKQILMTNGFNNRYKMFFIYYTLLVIGSDTWRYSSKIKGLKMMIG
jgi:hypothetical protein